MLCNSISYLVGNGHCSKVDTMFQHGQMAKEYVCRRGADVIGLKAKVPKWTK